MYWQGQDHGQPWLRLDLCTIWRDTPAFSILAVGYKLLSIIIGLYYLWKRDKHPDLSVQPFNHWQNSSKLAFSNSQSVSIMVFLHEFPLTDGFCLAQNRKLVRRSQSSWARNSGVQLQHTHCLAAPSKTAGSLRSSRWMRSFSGQELSDKLCTLRWWVLFIFKPLSSAMLYDVAARIFRCTIITTDNKNTGSCYDAYAGAYWGRSYIASRTYSFKQENHRWTTCHDQRSCFIPSETQNSSTDSTPRFLSIISMMAFGLLSFRAVCFLSF